MIEEKVMCEARKPVPDKQFWSHFDHTKNAFATSKKFVVTGKGDKAIVVDPEKDDRFRLDLSKKRVRHFELNARCAQWLLVDDIEVYFYTYGDVLVIKG